MRPAGGDTATTSTSGLAGAVAAPGTSGVRVEPVSGRRDLRRFLRLPWQLYRNDPAWIPPLLADQRALLDRRRHPFHRHAEVEYFLARRGGNVVGRIAAVVNRRFIEFHGEHTGFFGFFESVDDRDVAAALLGSAEEWLRRRGMTHVLGPMNFSTNEDCGLLVDGFAHPPAVMMPHNPPYYADLLDGSGYAKAKDLLAYWLEGPHVPERLARGVARLQRTEGIRIRPIELRHLERDVGHIQEIYNSAWERNWGFVPMTDEEFAYLARQLKQVVDPVVCLLAEAEGEPVGFALALPDLNQVLRHMDGRLFPFGLAKFFWYRRKINQARVLTLGLKPGYRRKGLDAMLYLRIFENGLNAGYGRAECSWILEDNWEMRRGLERMGAHVYKTYRVFEKAL